MNKVILQLWEESNQNDGVFSNGCSIHINEDERIKFVSKRTESYSEPQNFRNELIFL